MLLLLPAPLLSAWLASPHPRETLSHSLTPPPLQGTGVCCDVTDLWVGAAGGGASVPAHPWHTGRIQDLRILAAARDALQRLWGLNQGHGVGVGGDAGGRGSRLGVRSLGQVLGNSLAPGPSLAHLGNGGSAFLPTCRAVCARSAQDTAGADECASQERERPVRAIRGAPWGLPCPPQPPPLWFGEQGPALWRSPSLGLKLAHKFLAAWLGLTADNSNQMFAAAGAQPPPAASCVLTHGGHTKPGEATACHRHP